MYLLLDTTLNGGNYDINAVSLCGGTPLASAIAAGNSSDDYEYVEDTDLPTDIETFLNNFEKYEIVGGNIQLRSGAVVGSRYIDVGDRDNTYPMALKRANSATIFANL